MDTRFEFVRNMVEIQSLAEKAKLLQEESRLRAFPKRAIKYMSFFNDEFGSMTMEECRAYMDEIVNLLNSETEM